MDTKFGGLSWGAVCKKIENFCNDNDLVQSPRKYVDTVGKHVKLLIDEVVSDWVDPPGPCAEDGPDTEMWMVPVTTNADSNKLMEGFEGTKSDATNADLEALHAEKMSVASSSHFDHLGDTDSHTHAEGACSTEESCMNLTTEYDPESSSFSVPSGDLLDVAPLPFEPLTGKALRYECHHDKSIEPGSQLDGSDSHAETTGLSVGFDNGDYFNHGISHDLNMELTGQFQAIDLQGSWDDDEDYELAMIALHESRQRPFKKNLSTAFISKLRLLKRKNKEGKSHSDIDVRKIDRWGSCSSDNVKNDTDSDWELL